MSPVAYFCVSCDARCFPTGLVNPGALRGDSCSAVLKRIALDKTMKEA